MQIVICDPSFYYGESNVFGDPKFHRMAFPLFSKTNEPVNLDETQEVAVVNAVKSIVRDDIVEVRRNLNNKIFTVMVSLNDYNKEHSETIKETIMQTLSLL